MTTGIVIDSSAVMVILQTEDGHDVLSERLTKAHPRLIDSGTADRALSAWRRYGKGRHPASLNFGDCFSYALAESTGLPLLCTGDDFTATDLPCVGPGSHDGGDVQR